MPNTRTFCLGILLFIQLSACRNSTPIEADIEQPVNHEITGVSVWDRISARDEPLRSAPRTSLLSLGESFLYLDTFAIDSANDNTKFLKVRLSDSSEVWVYDFASVLEAKPAVITTEVPLYLRPDLLTITETRLQPMAIVAVVAEWDEWIKIVNEKKESTGWIKKEYLTYNTIDLAFALLVKRHMEEGNPEERIQNLENLLENNPYANTIFTSELSHIIDEETSRLEEEEKERDREDNKKRDKNR